VKKVTLVIKKVDEKKLREFKAEAIRRGLTFSKAFEKAIDLWLKRGETTVEAVDINNKLYEEVKDELARKYRGKYVVIAEGRLLGVYDSLKEVSKVLKENPRIRRALVAKLGVDGPLRGEPEWWGGSIGSRSA